MKTNCQDQHRINSRGSLREPTLDRGAIHDYCNRYSCASPKVWKSRTRAFGLRSGMTLLEVVIALAMFVAAMTVISQILRMGSDSAIRAQFQADAATRGESKLNEVIAGVLPLNPVSSQAFEDDTKWVWSLTVDDETDATLKRLTVTVSHLNEQGQSDIETRFVRLMRDPLIFQQTGSESSTLETINSVL